MSLERPALRLQRGDPPHHEVCLFLLHDPLSAGGRWGSPPVPRIPGSWLCPPISGFGPCCRPAQGSRSPKVAPGISQPFRGASCPLLFIFLHWNFRSPALGEKGPRAYILVSQRPAVRWRSEDEYDRGIEIPLCPQNRERPVHEQARCMSGESGLPAGHFSSLNTPDTGLSQRRSCPGGPRSPPFFRLLGVGCVSAL